VSIEQIFKLSHCPAKRKRIERGFSMRLFAESRHRSRRKRASGSLQTAQSKVLRTTVLSDFDLFPPEHFRLGSRVLRPLEHHPLAQGVNRQCAAGCDRDVLLSANRSGLLTPTLCANPIGRISTSQGILFQHGRQEIVRDAPTARLKSSSHHR
jgi:hypothetical protein